MNFLQLVEAKREGVALTDAQIAEVVRGVVDGSVPDYQLAAWLMAVYFRGLNPAETRALTLNMRDSGDVLSWPDDGRPVVDKHSTGGIGDKVSLPLAPLLATLGFRVPMISGRGLGITGGTLDKLDSIPGFVTMQPKEKIAELVDKIGCAMIGQTAMMVPADKRLYALRDATATVPSQVLITASILSKKLAEGLEALILDVKWGNAAFMQTREDAQSLADAMTRLGNDCGTKTEAFLNDMNTPLGRTAGNWLEVLESVECLEGKGPDDLRDLVIECAARLLALTSKASDLGAARKTALDKLASGEPRAKWDELLAAQGADMKAFEAKLAAPIDAVKWPVEAETGGEISRCEARLIGEVVRDLGGGRATKDSELNYNVGVGDMKKIGERVEKGEPLAFIYAATQSDAENATTRIRDAWTLE